MPLANWIKETTSTGGTGTITLVAEANQTAFADAFADTTVVDYIILDDNGNKEEGRGTVGAGKTLARTTVAATLVSGTYDDTTATAINLSGSATVIFDLGQASSFDKYDTTFVNSIRRVGSTISGATSDTQVNLGNNSQTGGNNSGVLCGLGHTAMAHSSAVLSGSGNDVLSSAPGSVICGGENHTISGGASFIGGGNLNQVTSAGAAVVCGSRNWAEHGASTVVGNGGRTRAVYDLIIGNVNSAANVANNKIRLAGNTGDILIDGSLSSPEAGIGECAEWADGNPDNEDRTGLAVSLAQGKLVVGGVGKIRGVISVTCSLISNNSPNHWGGMYLRDNLKRKLYDTYTQISWVGDDSKSQEVYANSEGKLFAEYPNPTELVGIPTTLTPSTDATRRTIQVRRMNPAFDVTKAPGYRPRSERPEWGVVEVKGQPWCLIAEPITSEYIKFNLEGKAVNASDELDGYPVMQRGDGVVQIWFID